MTDSGLVASGTPSSTGDVVGNNVSSPWVPSHPNAQITQAWGVTDYTGEPPGHGHPHWHAGIDVGYPTNTVVQLPNDPNWLSSILGTVQSVPIVGSAAFGSLVTEVSGQFHQGVWNGSKYVPDPGGYGDHATTITIGDNDIILGHGVAWLQADGATVRAGDQLIKTDCEGNCSGPHLHFELRPKQGAYGSDVDPWKMFTTGQGTTGLQNNTDVVGQDIQNASNSLAGAITGVGNEIVQVGAGLALGALGVVALGTAVYLFGREVSNSGVGRSARSAVPRIPRGGTGRTAGPDARVRRARGNNAAPAAPRRLTRAPVSTPHTTVPRVGTGVVNSSKEARGVGLSSGGSMRERINAAMDEATLRKGALIRVNKERIAARNPGRSQVPPF